MRIDLNKDIEDIRVIHRKCLSVISSCKTFNQIQNAEVCFNLALRYWYTKYPNKNTWKDHRRILEIVRKNIDTFLTLRRRQIRKH